jgi:hypothetical protein
VTSAVLLFGCPFAFGSSICGFSTRLRVSWLKFDFFCSKFRNHKSKIINGDPMPRTSLYNINNNAGAFTSIPSTIPARRVEIREDESVTPQGLQYQKPDDNFTNTYQCGVPAGPDQPQIVLGNVIAHQGRYGALLGLPAQSTGGASIPATVYAKVRAAGVSTSRIRVVEFE